MNRASVRTTAIAIALSLGGLALGAAAAQAHEGEKAGGHPMMEKMQQNLGLTPDQQKQVEQIKQEYQPRRQALMDQMKALHEEESGKIRAILTPEQQAKFDKMRAEMKEHRGERKEAWKDKKEEWQKKRESQGAPSGT